MGADASKELVRLEAEAVDNNGKSNDKSYLDSASAKQASPTSHSLHISHLSKRSRLALSTKARLNGFNNIPPTDTLTGAGTKRRTQRVIAGVQRCADFELAPWPVNTDESIYSRGSPHRERSPLYMPNALDMDVVTYPQGRRDRDGVSPFYCQEVPQLSGKVDSAHPGQYFPQRSFHAAHEHVSYQNDSDDVESVYARRRTYTLQSRRENAFPTTGESITSNVYHLLNREELISRGTNGHEFHFSSRPEWHESSGQHLPIADGEQSHPQHSLRGEKLPHFDNKHARVSKDATVARHEWHSLRVNGRPLYYGRDNLNSDPESTFPGPDDSPSPHALRSNTPVSASLRHPNQNLIPELNMHNIVHPNQGVAAAAAAAAPADHPIIRPQETGRGLIGYAPHLVEQQVRYGPPVPLQHVWPLPLLPHSGVPMVAWPVGDLMRFPPFAHPEGADSMLLYASPQPMSMPTGPTHAHDNGIPIAPTTSSSDHAGSSYCTSYAKHSSSINITVAHANYPQAHLSEEQIELTENVLFDAILMERDSYVWPAFTGSVHNKGCIVFTCADGNTARWLTRIVPSLIPWRGGKLKTLESSFEHADIDRRIVLVEIPDSALSDKAILQALKAQNAALNTDLWMVVYRRRHLRGFQLTIEIDLQSYNALARRNYSAFFRYSTVSFQPAIISL